MAESSGSVNIAEVRAEWIGVEFDWAEFIIDKDAMIQWASACGENRRKIHRSIAF